MLSFYIFQNCVVVAACVVFPVCPDVTGCFVEIALADEWNLMGDLVVVTFLVVNVVFLSVVCVFAVVAACVLVGACVVVTAGEDVAACDVKQTFIVE